MRGVHKKNDSFASGITTLGSLEKNVSLPNIVNSNWKLRDEVIKI